MKIIIILSIFLSQVFFIFSLDVEKEKGSVQQIIKEVISKSHPPFDNEDEEYAAFDSKISKITNGVEKFSEPLKYKKSYDLDINSDSKNDMNQQIEFNMIKSGTGVIDLSITAAFNLDNYNLETETVPEIIKIKKSKIKVLIKNSWKEENKEGMKMMLEISGDVEYFSDTDVKCSFNISGTADSNNQMPGPLSGKIKLNNKDYDYQLDLSSIAK